MASALLRGLIVSRREPFEKWYTLRHVAATAHALHEARAKSHSTDLVVVPEGICQRTFMAFVDADGVVDRDLARRLVTGAPQPDVVVVLRVTPEVALDRIRNRPHGALSNRFDGLEEHELVQHLAAGQELLLDVAEHLRHVSGDRVRCLVLDGNDLDAACDILCEALLGPRRPADAHGIRVDGAGGARGPEPRGR